MKRQLTREQLAAAGARQWRSWLRDGLIAYTRYPRPEERIRAFLPLVVTPTSHNPAGELAEKILDLVGGKASIAAVAAGQVVQDWSVQLDGAEGALVALELAVRLGTPGITVVCMRLLDQHGSLDSGVAQNMAWIAIRAVATREPPARLLQLGRRIDEVRLWAPYLVAEFAVSLGKISLRDFPARLLEATPILLAEPHSGVFVSELATRLRSSFSEPALKAALAPPQKRPEKEDVSRFRRDLADQLGVVEDDAPPTAPASGLADLKQRAQKASDKVESTDEASVREAFAHTERLRLAFEVERDWKKPLH